MLVASRFTVFFTASVFYWVLMTPFCRVIMWWWFFFSGLKSFRDSVRCGFSNIRVFSNESVLLSRWPKYWSFSFSINPSNEYSGLISFKMDWLDLLAVQGTLKGLFQHHSSKASILRCSAFFKVQLWHPYMTTGKTIALTRWTFVSKVMSLLLNMLSRLVTVFLQMNKYALISWLQSPSAMILEPPKKLSLSLFPLFPHYLQRTDGSGCHDLTFLNVEF